MEKIADLVLGELLSGPTKRLILSIVGPSAMEYLAYLEGQPLSIRLTIWAVWIVLVYLLTSALHSQYVNRSARRRAAFSADLREFMKELTALRGRWTEGDAPQHEELRNSIYARVLQYDESMAHEFMGVREREAYPECLPNEIGKLVSFQITSRPRV